MRPGVRPVVQPPYHAPYPPHHVVQPPHHVVQPPHHHVIQQPRGPMKPGYRY